MAQEPVAAIDVQDIQFKLQNRHTIFAEKASSRDNINLLAVASNYGLLFVGDPLEANVQAILLQSAAGPKISESYAKLRKVTLPSLPNVLSCNADGSLLALNYTLNNAGVLDIYDVASFLSSHPRVLYNIRLATQENAAALQLLWNPVMSKSLAVVLNNGALMVYTLKDGGAFELHSLDKSQQAKCGCWSPKGKQIVIGFENGTIKQFKPDLTHVKTIACPGGVHPAPFDTIAVHWLSTYQFAIVFLQRADGSSPSIYILNAPKGGSPVYVNYNDICYSGPGPRLHQYFFIHIQQWNILLVAASNGVEVGVLGTNESTDMPTWVHYMLLDEARIEMPLTDNSDETYPIGIAFDTSPMYQLVVAEKKLPTMPMVHVLTTHGQLLCFNFLNLMPNAANINSPPPTINYAPEHFGPLNNQIAFSSSSSGEESPGHIDTKLTNKATISNEQGKFGMSAKTTAANSTTAFSPLAAQTSGQMFRQKTNSAPFMELKPENVSSFGSAGAMTNIAVANTKLETNGDTAKASTEQRPVESNVPLYTLSPTFTVNATPAATIAQNPKQRNVTPQAPIDYNIFKDAIELNDFINNIIAAQVATFDKEIKQLANKSKEAQISDVDVAAIKTYSKHLVQLKDFMNQANEHDFMLDIQDLRHSFNESYKMLMECRSKYDMYTNSNDDGLNRVSVLDSISQRQLSNLRICLAVNKALLQQLQDKLDSRWVSYQDLIRHNARTQVHIPYLDGVFQRLSKFKALVEQQRTKINFLKAILKRKDMSYNISNDTHNTVESLADSVLSMSLYQESKTKWFKLSKKKLEAIRNCTRKHEKVTIIKPKRPMRVNLASEIILESKNSKKSEEPAKIEKSFKSLGNKKQTTPKPASAVKEPQVKGKSGPIEVKPQVSFMAAEATQTQAPQQATFPSFGFGSSPFAKAAPVSMKITMPHKSGTGAETDCSKMQPVSFVDLKPPVSQRVEAKTDTSKAPHLQTAILFSPKVIDSNVIKKQLNNVAESSNEDVTPLQQHQQALLLKSKEVPSSNSSSGDLASFGFSVMKAPSNVFDKFPDAAAELFKVAPSTDPESSIFGTMIVTSSGTQKGTAITKDSSPKPKPVTTSNELVADNFTETLNICKPTQKIIDSRLSDGVEFGLSTPGGAIITPGNVNNSNLGNAPKPQVDTPIATQPTTASSIFSGAAPSPGSSSALTFSFAEAAASSNATSSETPSPLFSSTMASSTSFNSTPWNATPPLVTSTNAPLFGGSAKSPSPSTANPVASNIFGGTPKSDNLLYNNFSISKSELSTNKLETTTETGSSLFGGASSGTSLGNIFGGNQSGSSFKSPITGNIFESVTPTGIKALGIPPAAGGSIFSENSAAKPAEGTNIFNIGAKSNVASGGSIFGGNNSVFGKTDTTIFNSAENTPKTEFSFGKTSITNPTRNTSVPNLTGITGDFGNTSITNAPGNSSSGSGSYLFVGAPTSPETPALATSPTAGGFAANMQSGNIQPFGSFAQGGGSVARVGFGAAVQQQSSFVKPVFGGTPTFGNSLALKTQPNFGGAPTFGTPKGFSTFSNTSMSPNEIPLGTVTPKNNIFEALGSTDTGLSFGNLAQATSNASTPKPTFGGSSFMNYRA